MREQYISSIEKSDAEIRRMFSFLVDGVASQKERNRLSNSQIGYNLDIGKNTIAKLLDDQDVHLTATQLLRLIRFAGFKLSRRDTDV